MATKKTTTGGAKKASARTAPKRSTGAGKQTKMNFNARAPKAPKAPANTNRSLVVRPKYEVATTKSGAKPPAKIGTRAVAVRPKGEVATKRAVTKTGSKLPPKIDYKETAKLTGKASVKSLLKDAFTKITKVAAMVDVASNMPSSRKKSESEKDSDSIRSYKARYKKQGLSDSKALAAAKKELAKTKKAMQSRKADAVKTGAAMKKAAALSANTGITSAKAKPATKKKVTDTKSKPMVGPGATSKPSNLITKPVVKTETKTVTPVKSAPTVSQVWKDKTGMSWSEAKNLGLSDGSASSNMRLLKKLQSGEINKDFIAEARAKKDIAFIAPNVTQDEANMEAVPNPSAYRRGGSVKRKRK
jgi:hypothetical protein